MKKLFSLPILIFFFAACNVTADNQVPELANQMCDCFNGVSEKLTENDKVFLRSVIIAPNAQAAFEKEMEKMKPTEILAFNKLVEPIQDKNSLQYKCLLAFDEKNKNKRTFDEKALQKKIVDELAKKEKCLLAAVLFKMGLEK